MEALVVEGISTTASTLASWGIHMAKAHTYNLELLRFWVRICFKSMTVSEFHRKSPDPNVPARPSDLSLVLSDRICSRELLVVSVIKATRKPTNRAIYIDFAHANSLSRLL
jgi:hypothetical protein